MTEKGKYRSAKSDNLKLNLDELSFNNSQAKMYIEQSLSQTISKPRKKASSQSSGTKINILKRGAVPKGYKGYGI